MIDQKKLYCNNCPKMLKLNFYQDKNNKIVLIQLNFEKSLHNLLENLLHIRYKVKEASTHEDSSREARRKCDDWTPPRWSCARQTLSDNDRFLKMPYLLLELGSMLFLSWEMMIKGTIPKNIVVRVMASNIPTCTEWENTISQEWLTIIGLFYLHHC